MKKTKYILVILLLWATENFAQEKSRSLMDFQQKVKEEKSGMRRAGSPSLKNVQGTPYLSEKFLPSKVYFIDQDKPIEANLRYNAYSDDFEFFQGGNNYVISNMEHIDSIKYFGHNFVHTAYTKKKGGLFGGSTDEMEGFLARLVNGPCSLYKVYSVKFHDAKSAKTGYNDPKPPRFEKETPIYCIQLKNDPHPRVIQSFREKKFLDNFGSLDKKLKKYIKESNIRLKEEDNLIKFIKYYNQQYGNKKRFNP
ncbi:MAG: hypothetical protein R6U04_00550 [Bacteroidales bacterium]